MLGPGKVGFLWFLGCLVICNQLLDLDYRIDCDLISYKSAGLQLVLGIKFCGLSVI